MKKLFAMAAVVLMTVGGVMAQNTFKGVVKYKVESTGEVAIDIPEDWRTAEIKVSGDDMFTKSPIFCGQMSDAILVQNLKTSACQNLSQLLGALRARDFEFTYEGSGKILVKNEAKASDFDIVDIPDTEPGHFYYEYVPSETKQIAGYTAKKMIRHMYDDEGVDHPMVMWYSDEIGPKINILFGGIKGMPLECTMDQGEGRAITYTATEIIKGKVKETDFLLPDGYDTLSEEEMETLGTEIQDAIELLQAEE